MGNLYVCGIGREEEGVRVIPLSLDDIQDGAPDMRETWSKMDWGFELGKSARLVDEPSQT